MSKGRQKERHHQAISGKYYRKMINKQNPYINIENKQPLNNFASAVQNQNNTNYANTAQQNNYQNVQAQPQQRYDYLS